MDILNEYRKDGNGLHSFFDPESQDQYLYSNFPCDYCHYLFPCFDQPDLKAKWILIAAVPEEWTVVSNEPTVEKTQEESQQVLEYLKSVKENFGP